MRFLILFFVACPALAGVRIGSEALLNLPDRARYNAAISWSPGTNETVSLNPPMFSWPYMEDPTFSTTTYVAANQFVFQIETNLTADFSSPFFQIKLPYNFFCTLATNGPPSFKWRVGYVPASFSAGGLPRPGTVTNYTTARTNFVTGATLWDRSELTNATSISTNMAHPFFGVPKGSLLTYSNYLANCESNYANNNGELWQRQVGASWLQRRVAWTNWFNACWRDENDPTTSHGGCNAISPGDWAEAVSDASFVCMITGRTNGEPWSALNRLATTYLTGNDGSHSWAQQGNINFFGCCSEGMNEIRALAKGFDWLQGYLSASQRTNVLAAVEAGCQWHYYLGGASLFLINWDGVVNEQRPTFVITNSALSNSYVNPSSFVRKGTSHANTEFQTVWSAAMAVLPNVSTTNTFPQSGSAKDLFEIGLNWLLLRGYWAGDAVIHQSRGYGEQGVGDNRIVQSLANMQMAFTNQQFKLTPWLTGAANWLLRSTPPALENPYDQWGEGGTAGYIGFRVIYRNWAFLLGSGELYQRHTNDVGVIGISYGPPSSYTEDAEEMSIPYWFAYPGVANSGTNAVLFTNDGWVSGTTLPANTHAAFTNGIGFNFLARPYGGYSGAGAGSHTYCDDGVIEIWAKGANITAGGMGNVGTEGQPSWQNPTVTVNGLGQAQSSAFLPREYYSYIKAFTNTTTFTYALGDLTYSYPHDNVSVQNGPSTYNTLHSGGPLAGLSKMHRHVLFTGKYFVIYDDMSMDTNSTFSWVWHITRTNTTLIDTNNCSFSFVATNQVGVLVTSYVYHAVSPSTMTLTNLMGTNVYGNPITGENYAWADPNPRKHAIWIKNKTATTNWHFLSVIVPAAISAPSFSAPDDQTVVVTYDGVTETNTWNTNLTTYTYQVALSSGAPNPPPPPSLIQVSKGAGKMKLSGSARIQ